MTIETMRQALEALDAYSWEQVNAARAALRTAIAEAEKQEPTRLWLWKNFVEGRPEYWAFDNPFPCISVGGDPLTLGEPCGWALIKPSVNGRPDRLEQEVIDTVARFAAPPAQRQWVGLTDEEIEAVWKVAIVKDNGKHAQLDNQPFVHFARAIEAKLKEKNNG